MLNEVESNYDAFYHMVESATALSNSPSLEPKEDIAKLLKFIGEAYELDPQTISNFVALITEKLPAIGTTADIAGFFASIDDDLSNDDRLLFQTKVDVIHSLQQFAKADNLLITPSWFSYENYMPYSATMRLRELKIASTVGFLPCNREVGLMLFLGIGAQIDKAAGIRRLLQCAYWGDVLSIRLLRLAYKKTKDKKKEKLCEELTKLSQYIEEGITILPKDDTSSEEAKREFELISSVKQDIVLSGGKFTINYSFVEILLMDSIDYKTKMSYINDYGNGTWKEVSNPTSSPAKEFGFRIEE